MLSGVGRPAVIFLWSASSSWFPCGVSGWPSSSDSSAALTMFLSPNMIGTVVVWSAINKLPIRTPETFSTYQLHH